VIDAVIQAPALDPQAVDAFRVALAAQGVRRAPGAARLAGIADDPGTREIAAALAAFWNCDAALVRPTMRGADFRVLAMDMDSTTITIETIDELARLAGKGDQVAAITAASMRGEIADFTESLRRRVAMLAGADAALIERVRRERLRISDGAHRLLGAARNWGWTSLLISGGFDAFAGPVGAELGFDAVCANHLVIEGGRLTGEVIGPPDNGGRIVDGAAKADALQRLCARLGHSGTGTAIAIGDGANDLPMMAAAGLSIAFHAKPAVQGAADCALNHSGLDGVLALFADHW
jgi:phosphoserine phosphatase